MVKSKTKTKVRFVSAACTAIVLAAFMLMVNTTVPVYAFYELGSSENCVDIQLALDYDIYKEVRKDTDIYTIDDDGTIFDYDYDTINIKNEYGGRYDLDALQAEGYKTLALEIKLDIWELDDGYQHICIYDDTTKTTWLAGLTLDHNYGQKHTYHLYVEIALAKIKENDIVVRYDASGAWGDTWQNSNLKFQAGFSKELRKNGNIWTLESKSDGSYNCKQYSIYRP